MAAKKKQQYVQKVALNVVREINPGQFQVYQIYDTMMIPLLGKRIRGQFVETPARTVREAFDRLYKEYYQ